MNYNRYVQANSCCANLLSYIELTGQFRGVHNMSKLALTLKMPVIAGFVTDKSLCSN